MKKIGIDARLCFQTGVGVYLRNLLFYLEKIIPPDFLVIVYLMEKDYQKIEFKNSHFIKKRTDCHWHSLSEQLRLYRLLSDENLDLVHFTYFSYPVLYKKKFISTVHDLTPLFLKTGKASTKNPWLYLTKYHILKFVLASQIKNATAIITPSRSVKKQLVEYYGLKYKNKILPVYEGVNNELISAQENQQLKKKFSHQKFFIYVGNFYPHKNVDRLIQSFAKIKEDITLVLIGPDDYFYQRLHRLIEQLQQKKRIILYKNPTLSDLVFFYKKALALIHPSLSEGFGLPLIEAAYFNLPVIASNIAVFQEILDGNYLPFNPHENSTIVDKINYFLKYRPQFDYKSILTRYSFEKMARETLAIYKRIL